jgi:hypothetical protein
MYLKYTVYQYTHSCLYVRTSLVPTLVTPRLTYQPAWTMDADAMTAAAAATAATAATAAAAAASQSERDTTSAMLQRLALEASTAGMPPAVNHIAVKLPEFWTKELELWFMQAETTFRRAKITCSHTKYDYVLQRLPMDVLVSLKELACRVCTGEVDDPYEQLETKLTASYQRSLWQLTFDLLDMPDLGDRRPSVLMDNMLASLPYDCRPDPLFLALFLSRLLPDIRDQIVAQDLQEPAVADRIYDARPQGGAVQAVHQVVTVEVRSVDGRSPSPAGRCYLVNRRDRSRRRTSRRRDDDGGSSNGLCFYHTNFGVRASRCR